MSKKIFNPEERFNSRAKKYDSDINDIIPGYSVLHEIAHHILKDSAPEKARILIAGMGTGYEAIEYATNNKGWYITGFDISGKMQKVAQRKFKKCKIESQVEFVKGGIEKINKGSFNSVTSILVMHFIKNKKGAVLDN